MIVRFFKTALWALVLVVVAINGAANTAAVADDNPIFTIPTEMCRGYFFIPVTLAPKEGYPADRTLWFLFDTGAGSTHVDPESIERVSGKRLAVGKRVSITDATAGPVNIKKMSAKIADLDHLSHALGREIDGIMAFETFQDFLLTLDYQTGAIRLQKGNLPKPDQVNVFEAKGPDDRPWLEVEFSNRKRRMLIDSGAALTSLVVNKLSKFELVAKPRPTGYVFGFNDREIRYSARAALNAHIGDFVLVQPMLQSTKETELIGGDVMRHFSWTFDQDKERVRLVKYDSDNPVVFKSLRGHGIILNSHPEGFEVVGFLEDTPASRSSLQAGDVITLWNGLPILDRGCGDDFAGAKTMSLGIRRDGVRQEIILDLFDLVQ